MFEKEKAGIVKEALKRFYAIRIEENVGYRNRQTFYRAAKQKFTKQVKEST